MILVKRENGNVINSYEVWGFTINSDTKQILCNLTKYSINEKGIPSAQDISYVMFDGKDTETVVENQKVKVVQRDSSGAIQFDGDGNALTKIEEGPVSRIKEIIRTEYSNFDKAISSSYGLIDNCKKSILDSYKRIVLKDNSYVIEV